MIAYYAGPELRKAPKTAPAMTPTLQFIFDWLVRCAANELRCPTADQIRDELARAGLPHGKGTAPTTALAFMGRIRVHVHARNWRVVEILDGPHAGQQTKGAPNGHACYLVIDRAGSRRVEM